jgi:hypothetical protein
MTEAFAVAQYIRSVSVDQTKSGLLLLTIGIVVSSVSIIQPVGNFIALSGLISLIHGRQPFGQKHSSIVFTASAFFFLGLSLSLVASIGHLLFALSAYGPLIPITWLFPTNVALANALAPSLTSLLAIGAAGAILIGTAYTLFTFSLQKMTERVILLAALAVNTGIALLILSLLNSSAAPVVNWYRSGADPDLARASEFQVLIVNLLNFVPAIIYAATFLRLYSRID